ncbi:hypothetical protein SLS56_004508 [Neofusicoccum ribis]|uniref:Xylanolytic transcriptional activator regulatory domain-containing protein n=1 Tax=Neofusicoccum ribis TaxID=45134 RepID=A0ABR3SW58_9PEZI
MSVDSENQPVPPQGRIFNNIRATYTPPESPSCVLQLYYGPSSNFSFLQHIHSHLTTRQASQSVNEGHDGDEGIEKYKYNGIVFGSVANQGPAPSTVFLRYELAKAFLQNYLSTIHHFMPLLDPERLRSTFERLYGSRNKTEPVEPLEKALLVISMAMGAISTEHEDWRETLLAQARTEAESVRYHVNVKAVQIALLMAHCEFATGHPNLSYLSLGSAISKALAAGMHKEGRGSDSRSEANHTMWVLFCNESISCLMTGRPYLLNRENITIPLPERPSFRTAFVRLSMTIRRTHRMYHHHDASIISELIESVHCIHQELKEFSNLAKEDLGVVIGGSTCPLDGQKLSWHIVTNYRMAFLGLCNHGYFLESACFVLVLAAVHDHGSTAASHVQYITRGLASCRKLVQREPVRSVVAALEQMLEKLEARGAGRQGSATDPGSGAVETVEAEQREVPAEPLVQQDGASQHGLWSGQDQGMAHSAGGDAMLDDVEWPNMDWGVDFSVLEMESFVSVMGSQQGFHSLF